MEFFQYKDGSDIYRFPAVYMIETHFLLENLWISEPSLGILEKFQRSSAVPNIKYNCALLFWSQLYWVFRANKVTNTLSLHSSEVHLCIWTEETRKSWIYLRLKVFFLIDTDGKIGTEIIDLVVLGRNYWSSCRVLL